MLTSEVSLGEEDQEVEQDGVSQQHANANPAPPLFIEQAPLVQHRQPHCAAPVWLLPPRCAGNRHDFHAMSFTGLDSDSMYQLQSALS